MVWQSEGKVSTVEIQRFNVILFTILSFSVEWASRTWSLNGVSEEIYRGLGLSESAGLASSSQLRLDHFFAKWNPKNKAALLRNAFNSIHM